MTLRSLKQAITYLQALERTNFGIRPKGQRRTQCNLASLGFAPTFGQLRIRWRLRSSVGHVAHKRRQWRRTDQLGAGPYWVPAPTAYSGYANAGAL